jgi:hypothetical protein
MLLGASPAILTFLIRLFVPESERWQKEKSKGSTSHWAARDLIGILVGVAGAGVLIYLWAGRLVMEPPKPDALPVEPQAFDYSWLAVQIAGTVAALALITVSYCYPVVRYLQRSEQDTNGKPAVWLPTVRRMLLGACLSGVALIVTWSAVQWAPLWVDQISGEAPQAKERYVFFSSIGAILGCVGGALLGGWLGRRITYSLLCGFSLLAVLAFYLGNTHYGPLLLFTAFLMGLFTASFYGWLPLYLPELFTTRVRATGQGFSYNFGRNLAVVSVLITGSLTNALEGHYDQAGVIVSLVYIVGLVVIWFAPETRGQPLPE